MRSRVITLVLVSLVALGLTTAPVYAAYFGAEKRVPATVQVVEYQEPGDANGDGSVNVQDMTKVARTILRLDADTLGADADQNDVVNVLDMTKIARIILGMD